MRFWFGRAALAGLGVIVLVSTGALAWPSAFGLRSVCLEESAYFCIRVDDVAGFGRPARAMALDHLAHGINDRADPQLLLSPYVQGVDELVAHRFTEPRIDALFVGGGAYTLIRAWQARYPDGRFLVAELDPAVTDVARRELWFEPGADTEIRHGDARRVLQHLPDGTRFDVIFGDAFQDISIPQHLVTHEFNELVASRLKPGGVYVLNVVDTLRTPRFMLSLAQTLNASFPSVELWLDRESVQPAEIRTTWIVLASDRETPSDSLAAEYGFGREWARLPFDRMIGAVGSDRLVFLTDDFAPVDRLLAPVLLSADLAGGGAR